MGKLQTSCQNEMISNLQPDHMLWPDNRKGGRIPTSREMNDNDSDHSTNSYVQSCGGRVEIIERLGSQTSFSSSTTWWEPQQWQERHQWQDDKIGKDGRNGRSEYRFPEPPSHFAIFFASQSTVFFCKISRTDISECRARDGQWRQIISPYAPQTHIFLVHATFHQRTCVVSK